ncbi:MAG: hypothetical protein GC160_06580 [Acidobacteria bacterium]|nr:hypothetical protein [Acidobacteriota bacterium]
MLMKKYAQSEIATELIYKAISELRDELALLDSAIEQVEALAEDPPRKVRPRRTDPNRPIYKSGRGKDNGHGAFQA